MVSIWPDNWGCPMLIPHRTTMGDPAIPISSQAPTPLETKLEPLQEQLRNLKSTIGPVVELTSMKNKLLENLEVVDITIGLITDMGSKPSEDLEAVDITVGLIKDLANMGRKLSENLEAVDIIIKLMKELANMESKLLEDLEAVDITIKLLKEVANAGNKLLETLKAGEIIVLEYRDAVATAKLQDEELGLYGHPSQAQGNRQQRRDNGGTTIAFNSNSITSYNTRSEREQSHIQSLPSDRDRPVVVNDSDSELSAKEIHVRFGEQYAVEIWALTVKESYFIFKDAYKQIGKMLLGLADAQVIALELLVGLERTQIVLLSCTTVVSGQDFSALDSCSKSEEWTDKEKADFTLKFTRYVRGAWFREDVLDKWDELVKVS